MTVASISAGTSWSGAAPSAPDAVPVRSPKACLRLLRHSSSSSERSKERTGASASDSAVPVRLETMKSSHACSKRCCCALSAAVRTACTLACGEKQSTEAKCGPSVCSSPALADAAFVRACVAAPCCTLLCCPYPCQSTMRLCVAREDARDEVLHRVWTKPCTKNEFILQPLHGPSGRAKLVWLKGKMRVGKGAALPKPLLAVLPFLSPVTAWLCMGAPRSLLVARRGGSGPGL